jgi:hypothetical protein
MGLPKGARGLEGTNERGDSIMTSRHTRERLTVIGRASNGQPRSYRLSRPQSREAAHWRLAVAILALDVKTLTDVLRSTRTSGQPSAAMALGRAA